MATSGDFTIGSGQDFTSIENWEAGVTGALTGDYIGRCVTQEDEARGSGLTFDNASSPTARYILRGEGAGKHSGVENTGYRFIGTFGANRGLFTTGGDFTITIEDLELVLESGSSALIRHATAAANNNNEIDVNRCLIYPDRNGNDAPTLANIFIATSGGLWTHYTHVRFESCHIRSLRVVGDNSTIHRIVNCTMLGNTDGTPITGQHGMFGCQAINNYAAYCGNGSTRFSYNNLAAGSSNNASGDGSGSAGLQNIDPTTVLTQVTYPCDYHAINDSTALAGAGTAVAGVTLDIDGDAFKSPPTVGEDEVVAAGPAITAPTVTYNDPGNVTGSTTTTVQNGTLYGVVTDQSSPPTAAQIKTGTAPGQDGARQEAPVLNGTPSLTFPDITNDAGRYFHFVQTDSGANDSNIVSSATAFEIKTIPAPAVTFPAQTGVDPLTTITSSLETVNGINVPVQVSTDFGEFSVNGDAFSSTPRNITVGQTLQVRHTSSQFFLNSNTSNLTIGNGAASFTSTTRAANLPVLSSPTATSITFDGAALGITTSDFSDGNVYYCVRVSSTPPASSAIKAGGADPLNLAFGNKAFASATEAFAASGLNSDTQYYYWFTQEGAEGDAAVQGDTFTTAAQNPSFGRSAPNEVQVTQVVVNAVDFNASASDPNPSQDNINHYARAYARGANPTIDQIILGQDGPSGALIATNLTPRLNTNSGSVQNWTINSGLTASQQIDIEYVIVNAANTSLRTQATTRQVDLPAAAPVITSTVPARPVNNSSSVLIRGSNFGVAQGQIRYNNVDISANIITWGVDEISVKWPDIPNESAFKNTRLSAVNHDLVVVTSESQISNNFAAPTDAEADAMWGQISATPGNPSIFEGTNPPTTADTYDPNDEAYGRWSVDPTGIGYDVDGSSRLTGRITAIPPGAVLSYRIFDISANEWSDDAVAAGAASNETFNLTGAPSISDVNSTDVITNAEPSGPNTVNGSDLGGATGVDVLDGVKTRAGTGVTSIPAQVSFSLPNVRSAPTSAHLRYGTVTVRLTGGTGFPVERTVVSLIPESGRSFDDITGVSAPVWPSKALPGGVTVGDQYEYVDITTPGGFAVSVDPATGTYQVATNGNLVEQTVKMWRYNGTTNEWASSDDTYQEPAPSLSALIVSPTSSAAGAGATANKPDGVIWFMVKVRGAPAPTTVQDLVDSVGAAGSGSISEANAYPNSTIFAASVTGLDASTDYDGYFAFRDEANNDSAISAAQQFTTLDPPVLPPVFNGPVPDQVYQVSVPVFLDFGAFFTGGSVDAYSSVGTSFPASLSFNTSNGILSGTPAAGDIGITTNHIIRATNTQASVDTNPFQIEITAAPVTVPQWNAIPDPQGVAGQAISFSFADYIASDGGDPNITYAASPLPTGAVLDPATGIVSGTYQAAESLANITVVATNSAGSSQTTMPAWTVSQAAQPPVWSPLPEINLQEGVPYADNLNNYCTGDQPITYASTGAPLPTGFAFNPTTGEITADGSQTAGTTTGHEFEASNAAQSGVKSDTFSVTVTAIPPAPVGGGQGATATLIGVGIGVPFNT